MSIPAGFAGTAIVKTAPCPKCTSFKTEATLYNGDVILRACHTCTWTWDAYDGKPDNYADDRREASR